MGYNSRGYDVVAFALCHRHIEECSVKCLLFFFFFDPHSNSQVMTQKFILSLRDVGQIPLLKVIQTMKWILKKQCFPDHRIHRLSQVILSFLNFNKIFGRVGDKI